MVAVLLRLRFRVLANTLQRNTFQLVAVIVGGTLTAGLALLAVLANWRLLTFFIAHLGLVRAILALLYHQIYYVYSAGAFAWCLFEYHVLGIRNRLHVP